MPLQALLFDFDGLLADTEPLHLAGFRETVAPLAMQVSDEDYYAEYVGYDDRDAFRAIFVAHGEAPPDPNHLRRLINTKARLVEAMFSRNLQACPGAVAFARAAAALLPVGVCSGALRHEVQMGLRTLGLADVFKYIVAAEDVGHSKPDPEGYNQLLTQLSVHGGLMLDPGHCAVLEDTVYGLQAGRAAGCRTIGVVGTEPREILAPHADLVVDSLDGLDPAGLARQLGL